MRSPVMTEGQSASACCTSWDQPVSDLFATIIVAKIIIVNSFIMILVILS